MKKLQYAFLLLFCCTLFPLLAQQITGEVSQEHPRLLLFKDDVKDIQKNIDSDKNWRQIHEDILAEADAMIPLPTLERIQIDRRLLDKSREALRRIYFLSYAYRMSDEQKYFTRAEAELLKVSGFSDWNPTHFLDVAEMTMAVSIGYDWPYDNLGKTSKKIIREAILKKGIEPSYDTRYNWFLKASHNRNQVCNAGMNFGALAIYGHHPELAKQTIERAVESIKLPMQDYQPSGAYPEGQGYWAYGTSFNVLFLNAVEKVFGSDFELTATHGFLKASDYIQHMIERTVTHVNHRLQIYIFK